MPADDIPSFLTLSTIPGRLRPALAGEFRNFARRAQVAAREESATIVREAMFVLGRLLHDTTGREGAAHDDARGWRTREREAARLLGKNDCTGAAVALLPAGARLKVETLNAFHEWAAVGTADAAILAEATAQSRASAIIAAQFMAIAHACEPDAGGSGSLSA